MRTSRCERVAIVGSRDFDGLGLVREYIRTLPADTLVITGGARGVDTVAEQEANNRGLHVAVIKALWGQFMRAAGPMRNRVVVDLADRVVAFWDGHSPGTAHAIVAARQAGKRVQVIRSQRQQEASCG